ncbi:kinase-like domain-containing protein [Haematococcus lacustris]
MGNLCGTKHQPDPCINDSKHGVSITHDPIPKPEPLEDFSLGAYFEVLRKLGEGGSGETFLCRDVRSGDVVAIKFIPRPIQKAVLPMIFHEVKIQAALGEGHVSLVQARELFLAKRHLGLAMEYVAGGNLTAYVTNKYDSTGIRNGLFLTEDEARYFFKQFLGAVEYLHQNHVAHRDIKLDNIVLDRSNPPRIKLCDFGFAKNWEGQSNMFTQIGTPVYMSPQVINSKSSNQGYDAQLADVWACGVLLFVMLLGMFPFEHSEHPDPNSSDAHAEVFLQQVKCSWRENPRIADSARKLSDNCRDLLDKIFEMQESKRIDIAGIRQHPWFLTPLPGVYESALAALAAEQAALTEQVAAGQHKVEARDQALQRLVNRAGEVHQEGLDSDILPRVWLAHGDPPYVFEVDEDDVDLDILEEEEEAAAANDAAK